MFLVSFFYISYVFCRLNLDIRAAKGLPFGFRHTNLEIRVARVCHLDLDIRAAKNCLCNLEIRTARSLPLETNH
jgi:hypothetical protein